MNHFNQIFPEVAKSNDTGKFTKTAFALWENNKNNISIEMDPSLDGKIHTKYDVYIGGPASAVAAALHAKSGESTFKASTSKNFWQTILTRFFKNIYEKDSFYLSFIHISL